MQDSDNKQHRTILQRIARQAMVAKGLVPDFPPDALAELEGIHGPATGTVGLTRDLRSLLWCSIDNDDSRDLDQLTVAEALPNGAAKVLVAIADVDAVVKRALSAGRSCAAKHHLGLHGCRNVPDAAGKALDGFHFTQLRFGPPCHRG